MAKLKITQVRSVIRQKQNQKATMRSLGIRRMHQTVVLPDNKSVRGMVETVRHLIKFEEISEE